MNARAPRLRLLAVAMTVDALGSGLFGPFGLLYGHEVAGLSLARTGTVLGVAATVALACGPMAGALADRIGAARVVIIANVVAVLGGLLLLTARDVWSFTLASILGVAAVRMFWSAFAPLIGALTGDHAERWLGLLRSARLAGVMLGGFAASGVLLLGRQQGLLLMLAVDTATYALAAVLTALATAGTHRPSVAAEPATTAGDHRPSVTAEPAATAGTHRPSVTARPAATARGSYRTVLRDRVLLRLTLLNTVCTLLASTPIIAMPVYLIETAGGPAWLPGLAAGLLTGTVAAAMTRTPLLTRGTGRLRVLGLAALLWAVGCLLLLPAPLAVVPVALTATVVLGLAQSFYEPTADAVALALAPVHLTGRYTAVYQLAWGVSAALSPVLAGVLLSAAPSLLWVTLAVLALLTAIAYHRAETPLGVRVGRSGTPLPAV
jgi:MFS family permease